MEISLQDFLEGVTIDQKANLHQTLINLHPFIVFKEQEQVKTLHRQDSDAEMAQSLQF